MPFTALPVCSPVFWKKTGPDFGAVVFDKPGPPTFRHTLFADYKAHRESAPAELNEQILRIKEIVEATVSPYMNWMNLRPMISLAHWPGKRKKER